MKIQFLIFALLSLWSFSAFAQNDFIYNNRQGAIKGYDPVAYFTESKPVKGKKDIAHQWKDANWYFANKENYEAFRADPEAYAPQFGGYCAYAMAEGVLYQIDPTAWKIVNGKLYLNYDLETQKAWEAEQDERIKKAEAYWPSVLYKDDN